MASTFLSGPGANTLKPSGQPLLFTVETDATITATFRFIVWVYETGALLGKYYLTPNDQATAHLDLGRIIEGRRTADTQRYAYPEENLFDSIATPFERSRNNIRDYLLQVGEFTGTESAAQDSYTVYLFDGYEQASQGLHPSFEDYYGTASSKKFWLTDRSVSGSYIEMTADDDDRGVIGCLIRSTVFSGDTIVYSVTYQNNTVASTALTINATNGAQLPSASTPVNGYLIYAALMPYNVEGIGGISLANWKSYTIQPYTIGTLTARGKAIRVTRQCEGSRGEQTLVAFSNSRGAWDYLKFELSATRSIQTEDKVYRKALINWSAYQPSSWLPWQPETIPFHKTATQSYQMRALLSIEESKLLPALFKARQIFARIDGAWQPLRLNESQGSYQTRTNSKMVDISITAQLAQAIRC